ncbi:hypothetical protein ACFX13_021860 [Malus domestica]
MFSKTIQSEIMIRPNASNFNGILSSLTEESLLELGRQIHSYVIRSEMSSNVSVETAIANMYVKCGWLEGARIVFDRMEERNAVVWTGLMVGYTEDEKLEEILELFAEMACAGLEDLNMGRQVRSYSVKLGLDSEVSVGTPLVDFYVKCSKFESACRAFKRIHDPIDVSWSAIISGYYLKFICTYKHSSSLLCNRGLDCANRAFESIDKPDSAAWTAIICGYAYHGNVFEALTLFKIMQNSGVKPNSITFIAVLAACSHSSLVTEGKQYLESMSKGGPTIDHYDCMIDVYSRVGQLQKALNLIYSMPFEPDAMSWKSLLGGCWMH